MKKYSSKKENSKNLKYLTKYNKLASGYRSKEMNSHFRNSSIDPTSIILPLKLTGEESTLEAYGVGSLNKTH